MNFKNLTVLDHPLIQQKMFYLRDKRTNNLNFRAMLNEISGLMVYEVTRNLPLRERELETPLEKTRGKVLAKQVTLVPILRAGLGMSDGIIRLIPHARVGHLGLYRDKDTLEPVECMHKFRFSTFFPANTNIGTTRLKILKITNTGSFQPFLFGRRPGFNIITFSGSKTQISTA